MHGVVIWVRTSRVVLRIRFICIISSEITILEKPIHFYACDRAIILWLLSREEGRKRLEIDADLHSCWRLKVAGHIYIGISRMTPHEPPKRHFRRTQRPIESRIGSPTYYLLFCVDENETNELKCSLAIHSNGFADKHFWKCCRGEIWLH